MKHMVLNVAIIHALSAALGASAFRQKVRNTIGTHAGAGVLPAFDAEENVTQFPSDIMTCPTGAVSVTTCMTSAQYDDIMLSVDNILNTMDSTCNADVCPQADWAGCVLRMAGHDFMDFKWGEGGGSDGCIDFNDMDNKGLKPCLATGGFLHQGEFGSGTMLTLYQEVCSSISLADFFVLAAEAVMTHTRHAAGLHDENFKASFQYGRTTAASCSFSHGRLPNPDNGCAATEEVFINNLDLTWEDSAALMGVHTLGRTHKENSGFHGWWSDPENSRKFNNNYYVSLLSKAWGATTVDGTGKTQYDRVDWGNKHSSSGNEMMLNTDMCLAFADVPAAEAITQSSCTCTWAMPMTDVVASMPHKEWCGSSKLVAKGVGEVSERAGTKACCKKSPSGASDTCDDIINPSGVAIEHVRRFAANDTAWFAAFQTAWTKATTMGFAHQSGILLPLKDVCSEADLARQVPDASFPVTTATTTTTTTPPPFMLSDETVGRWYFAASMESCTHTCLRNGKQCNQQSWHTYGHELDTYAEMSELISRITGLDRSVNPGALTAFNYTQGKKWYENFTSMGGGTTATAQRMYSGDQNTPVGIGSPWNSGETCAQDVNGSESFMTPAAHYLGRFPDRPKGRGGYQCKYNLPNRTYELDQCERHYHGASWRRLCVCDQSDPQPDTAPDASACLLLGNADPECCSRPSEASCTPGFKYSPGPLCMWSHDHDFFTTQCRPTGTTTTTTIPPVAEGYFLGPQGHSNCSSVCEEHAMKCTAEGFREAYNEISSPVTVAAIVEAIGQRDWLGLNQEAIYPICLKDGGSNGYKKVWPATWGSNNHHFSCHYFHHRKDASGLPDDHCDPAKAPGRGQWRRLCKCQQVTKQASEPADQPVASEPADQPLSTSFAGYSKVFTDGRCTNDEKMGWRDMEQGPHARSTQVSEEACAQRCDYTPGCTAFGYWPDGSNCRTYKACTLLSSQGSREYVGSVMYRRNP